MRIQHLLTLMCDAIARAGKDRDMADIEPREIPIYEEPSTTTTMNRNARSSKLITVSERLLTLCEQHLGEIGDGDETPDLVTDSTDEKFPVDPGMHERFLRDRHANGACVHIPAPGDMLILQAGVARRYWSGVVKSVAGNDMVIYCSQSFMPDAQTEYRTIDLKCVQGKWIVNSAWHVIGIIRF